MEDSDILAVFGAVLFQKMPGQHRDVLGPLTQGWDFQRGDAEAEEEILAEIACLHHLLQILVGGREQAHIDLNHLGAAQAFELPFLQHTQNLGLGGLAHVAVLVEKQHSLVGQLEAALALFCGAGEGPLLVTEQLALQQVLMQRRAVLFD